MEQLNPSDLKAILHSKRANLYYLEHARVMQKDGRVLYLTEAKNENQYWNIPIANTTVILLGTGTSITQAAMRMLASAGCWSVLQVAVERLYLWGAKLNG
jgi:CRISPR-associated protein Cas1